MSGGHFDYKQGWLDYELASELEYLIENNDSKELNDYGNPKGRNFSPEIIKKLKETAELAQKLSKMVHCVDYLLTGDYGEESFLKQWEKKVK